MPTAKINLELTSPPMQDGKGPLKRKHWVHDAQYLLDHNRTGHSFDPGTHDGQYGPHTAAATHRAKYLLGYPSRRVTTDFGPSLYAYLVPKGNKYAKIRPLSWRVRGKLRAKKLAREAKRTHAIRAVALALTQVGTTESPPYSNNCKYTQWYGFSGPWCAMFDSWCYSHVGRKLMYASVAAIHADALAHRGGLSLVGSPQRGDLCCMNFGTPDEHVGMFIEWVDGTYFKMVSGNTGLSSFSNGGEVLVGTFSRGLVDAWVRVSG